MALSGRVRYERVWVRLLEISQKEQITFREVALKNLRHMSKLISVHRCVCACVCVR